MCGDFNLVLNPSKDFQNYVNINSPKARSKVITMLNDWDLTDIYRANYPNLMHCTWRKSNPVKQARLEYFIVSSSMTDIIDSTSILPSYR